MVAPSPPAAAAAAAAAECEVADAEAASAAFEAAPRAPGRATTVPAAGGRGT